jgi:hypothetical protein
MPLDLMSRTRVEYFSSPLTSHTRFAFTCTHRSRLEDSRNSLSATFRAEIRFPVIASADRRHRDDDEMFSQMRVNSESVYAKLEPRRTSDWQRKAEKFAELIATRRLKFHVLRILKISFDARGSDKLSDSN